MRPLPANHFFCAERTSKPAHRSGSAGISIALTLELLYLFAELFLGLASTLLHPAQQFVLLAFSEEQIVIGQTRIFLL